MAQAMNTRARAIAIAAASAVALGGVQIAAPTDSVLAAGVTEAVAQEAGTFDPRNIEFLGFFDPDGNEYTGLLTNTETEKFAPEGSTPAGVVGSYVKLHITIPEGVKAGDGAFIKFNVDPKVNLPVILNRAAFNLEAGGQVIGTVENTSYGAKITFNENAANVQSAEANFNFKMHPASYIVWTKAEHERRQDAGLPTSGLSDVLPVSMNVYPVVNGKVGTQATTIETPLSMQLFATYQDPDTNKKRYVVGANKDAGTNDRVTILRGSVETPINDPEIYPNASSTYDVTVYPYVSPENGHPAWNFNTNFVLGEASNGATVTAKYRSDGGIDLHFENVPKGEQSKVYLSNLGRVSSTVPAKYTLRATQPDGKGAPYGTLTYGVTGPSGLDGDFDLTLLNHDTKMVGTIEGKNASDPNNPAPVAGGKRTVRLALTNNGNTPLVAPTLILPNGKKKTLEDVDIAPGETTTVSVEYDIPADAYTLTWKLESPFQKTPASLTQYVTKGNPLSGDVTVNDDGSITIDGPNGPITLAPIDKVNEAKKEAEDAKREADKANNRATQLEKDLAAEKARNDADAQKIAKLEKDLAQAKKDAADAAKRAEDAAKKAQSEVDALEKVVADLKANQAADREKIAGLEKQLQDAKDGLKRAQDAATAAQNAATAAQNTANQALADLAKERKRVDDLTKDLATERARVDDLTKRADKAEKDLADARKRVDALEKENKAQQGQIDQARKDITALQTEADRLGKELEAAKKRVATLEKENKEQAAAIDALKKQNADQQGQIDALKKENATQQKQINTLRADLTKAEKRISTLETQLRETQTELAAVSARLGVVEGRLNTGLGKCIDTLGGGLLAVVPIIAVLATAANHVQVPGVQAQLTQAQKQMGVYNPQLADFMYKNAGALVAGAGAIATLGMLLAPNTCRDNTSVGGAIGENLSSGRVTEKADQAADKAEDTTTKEAVAAK